MGRREHGLALLAEVRTGRAGRRRSAEPAEERGGGVDAGSVLARRVRDPDVELQAPADVGAEPSRPLGDPVRVVEHHPGGAHPTGLGDGDGELGRAGTRHRRLQDR